MVIIFLFKNIWLLTCAICVSHTTSWYRLFRRLHTSDHGVIRTEPFDILLGFADKVCCRKISRKRIGKYAAEFWTHVGDTFFCRDIFRASITVGWLVVSADACWQLRWSQAFVGGVSLENSHHCLRDGQHKGPKWLRATGCVWVFVCSANLCVCV